MNLYEFGLTYLNNNAPYYTIKNSEIGVITATDSNTFSGVKTLFYSLKDKINFLCYDIGMTQQQIKWCQDNNLPLSYLKTQIPQIDKWQTYIKPFIIDESPFAYTIWLDSDCVVTGNLSCSLNIQNTETFFTRHWINPKYLKKNNSKLYELYPVTGEPVFINAGVLAINKNKDAELLKQWIYMVENTITNEVIRQYVVNWDEGSLVWAIRKTHLEAKIIYENNSYNFFCDTTNESYSLQKNYLDFFVGPIGILDQQPAPTLFFKQLLKQNAFICHLSTCMSNKNKFWKKWTS